MARVCGEFCTVQTVRFVPSRRLDLYRPDGTNAGEYNANSVPVKQGTNRLNHVLLLYL